MPIDIKDKFKKNYKKDEIIFCEYELGSKIYYIQKGVVRLTKISNQVEKTLAKLKQGDIFGEMAMLEKMPRSATCIAITDVDLLAFDQESFLTLVKIQPMVGIKLIKSFAIRIVDQNRKLEIILLEQKDSKVLDTLLMLNEKGHSKLVDNKINSIKVNTKIEDISDWTNLSLEKVQNTLRALEVNNVLEIENDGIIIKNIEYVKNYIQKNKQRINLR